MNKLIISGRLTRDAEVRFIPSGTPVMSFSVANNTGFGDNQKTHYFECSLFGKRAEGGLKADSYTHLTLPTIYSV